MQKSLDMEQQEMLTILLLQLQDGEGGARAMKQAIEDAGLKARRN